ncbi:MAG: hypothetical protein HYU59_13420 [Magnetospirillum gryphiswaldense]|nr:hypothetical protein [Magnetospirillum gryphiswaldense]
MSGDLDMARASATLSWDQWLDYLDAHPPRQSRLGLPCGFDISNPGDLAWLMDAVDHLSLDRPRPSRPL